MNETTAARSAEVLRLDIEDLDLANRRSLIRRKGGAVRVHPARSPAMGTRPLRDPSAPGPLRDPSAPEETANGRPEPVRVHERQSRKQTNSS